MQKLFENVESLISDNFGEFITILFDDMLNEDYPTDDEVELPDNDDIGQSKEFYNNNCYNFTLSEENILLFTRKFLE